MEEIKNLLASQAQPVSLLVILWHLSVCAFLSFFIRTIYVNYSTAMTSSRYVANILVVTSLTTFLVILVVKSSLALSLGLVGALSIVRFRTPIKEPEELIFLFLAIAVGLGAGAGQVLVTTIITTVILLIFFLTSKRLRGRANNHPLDVTLTIEFEARCNIEELTKAVDEFSSSRKISRIDIDEKIGAITMKVQRPEQTEVADLLKNIRSIDGVLNVALYEQVLSF